MLNKYNEDELVRLELLCYKQPEGLHPIERKWRDLATKLLQDVKTLEGALVTHGHYKSPNEGQGCFKCSVQTQNFPRKWPEAFKE